MTTRSRTVTVPPQRDAGSSADDRVLASALAALDEPAAVTALTELVRVPSVGGTAAESDVQALLQREYAAAGLETDLWRLDLDALSADPAYPGQEVGRSEAWGLVGTTAGGGDGPVLVLQGHVDVVPAGERARWSTDPFAGTVRGGLLLGRGSCDMKAGVVASLAAARALHAAGVRLRGRLALHAVVGEEDGGIGAFGTVRRGHLGDACVITEPTSLGLVPAAAGALTFRLTLRGRAAHASVRTTGVSALRLLEPVSAALDALEARRNADPGPLFADSPLPYALSLGTVRAGDWASTVPETLVAEGRLGVRLDEEPEEARRQLEECLAEASAAHPWLRGQPVEVEWVGGQFAPGRLPEGSPLLGQVAAAHVEVHGGPVPSVRGVPYGSDLRLYAAAGVPTLHYGPGDVRLAHGPDEAVPVQEVLDCARTLIALAVRTCRTA